MVLVVTGTQPKTANGADAAIIPVPTVARGVGMAANRLSASSRVLAEVSVCLAVASDCAVMAAARAPNCSRRVAISAVIAKRAGAAGPRGEGVGPGGGGGSLQMRLLRS